MQYTKKKLSNGLRVITVPMKSNQTATVLVMVEAGSKYETEKQNGISHFLEHLCFKGTSNRNVFEITEELDGLGAESNAFTGDEFTGYYARAHHKHVDQLMDIVSDIYLNATLPKEEIEKERGVIIEEINMYEDMPQRIAVDVFEELLYDGQPAGRSVLGPKENIKTFKRGDFVRYRKKHYAPEATTVVVAGKIDEQEIQKKLKQTFEKTESANKPTMKPTKDVQTKPEIKLRYKNTDQAHLVLGCRAFSAHDECVYTAKVLATILGQGMSSRLFKKMRDELGMCYYVNAGMNDTTDSGYFAVRAGVGKNRIEEAIEVIIEEMQKLRDVPVGDDELTKAKEFIIGNQALSVESSAEYAEWFGFQEVMHTDLLDLREYNKKIRAVTKEDIYNVARDIFQNDGLNLAVVSSYKKSKQLKNKLRFE